MKILCDYFKKYPMLFTQYQESINCIIPINYTNYLNLLGPEKISSLDYVEADILNFIQSEKNRLSGRDDIIKSFEVGKRYTLKDIKEKLTNIYNSLGVSKTPKATDLNNYFILKDVVMIDKETKKRDKGFELLNLKE